MRAAKRPKILFLANWPRTTREPERFAFFAHWRSRPLVRFFGTFALGPVTRFEKQTLRFYLLQPLAALFLAPFYDAVVAFSSQSGLPFALLLRLCFWMRTRLIVFDVESFGRAERGVKLALTRFAARRIDWVVYAASGQAAYYDRHFPFLAARRSFVPIGIGGYEKRQPDDAGRDGPVVVPGKHGAAFRDWATFLRAAATIGDAVEFVIVGRDELPAAERDGVPIPPNVRLLPYVPLDRLQEILETARFVVLPLPDRAQSLGQLTILFAMAMGRAVVAARTVGVRDYLREGETGLGYRPGDAAELADCLRRMLADPDRTIAWGRRARELYREEFGDERMGRRWEEIYCRVVGRTPPAD
ncbi:MAG: glycosyltransferase family 4 protein [Myxococcales bacterium]|nr:glycosyltransferase family 4 protein [Myxococcales bacterium]